MSNGLLLRLPLALLIHPFSLSLGDKWTIKDVLWTHFNTDFSPVRPFLPFVLKGLMDNKGCPMDSF